LAKRRDRNSFRVGTLTCQLVAEPQKGVNAAALRGGFVYHWIRLHWFELSALVLLGLNLWFVIKVLSVLRAVQDGLILLARWLDIARNEIDRQPGAGNSGKR
jgi:hypothetical protein